MNPADLEELNAQARAGQKDVAALNAVAKTFGQSISGAFAKGIVQGRQFSDIVKGVAQSMEQMALKAAIQPVFNQVGSLMGTLLPSVSEAIGGGLSSLFSAATGIKLFADGGVVGTPTYFPTGAGLGVAGEAGPEAILPLARGADGKLGVRGGSFGQPVTVNVQIATPDAESFRRSEASMSAQLARAVARGQRGL